MEWLDKAALKWLYRGCPGDHPFTNALPSGLDWRGVPTAACPCGSRTFYAVLWLDDGYEIRGYETTGLCTDCGALVTLATLIDSPEYEEEQ